MTSELRPMTECLGCLSSAIDHVPLTLLEVQCPPWSELSRLASIVKACRLCSACRDKLSGLAYIDYRLPLMVLLDLSLRLGQWTRAEITKLSQLGHENVRVWSRLGRSDGDVYNSHDRNDTSVQTLVKTRNEVLTMLHKDLAHDVADDKTPLSKRLREVFDYGAIIL